MSIKNSEFFAREEMIANQEHLNAYGEDLNGDGYDDADGDDYDDADGDDYDDAIGEELNAGGRKVKTAKRAPALPIIIIATNTSSDIQYNVDLLDAVNKAYLADPSTAGSVTFRSGVNGITYTELVRTLTADAYTFGHLRITTESAPSGLVSAACSQALEHIARNTQGQSIITPINPSVNIHQNQSDVRDVEIAVSINNLSKLKTTLLANCSVKYELFPRDIYNATAGIKGATKKVANPKLNQIGKSSWAVKKK